MKKIFLLLVPILAILGCTSEGDIKVINRTKHNLYFTIENHDYVLEGYTEDGNYPSKRIEVKIGKNYLVAGNTKKDILVDIEGETFDVWDYENSVPVDSTVVAVKNGETTMIYADPTHAGVKLINNARMIITKFQYKQNGGEFIPIATDIAMGDSVWARLTYTTADNPIRYTFWLEYENGLIDTTTHADIDILYKDVQYQIGSSE